MTALARALLDELTDADLDMLAERLAPRLAARLPPVGEDRWLTTKEAAKYLGLSVHALHRLTAERRVPMHQERPGASCYFKRSELDQWRGV